MAGRTNSVDDARFAFIGNTIGLMHEDGRLWPDAAVITIDKTVDQVFVRQFRSMDKFADAAVTDGWKLDPRLIEDVRLCLRESPDKVCVVLWDENGTLIMQWRPGSGMKDYETTEDRLALMANMVRTMESETLPDTVIITIQRNDPDTSFKPHLGESWRAQVNQFRNPEHLAEALAEPEPDLIEEVRAARRDAPDELVIVLWDSFGMLLVTKKRRIAR